MPFLDTELPLRHILGARFARLAHYSFGMNPRLRADRETLFQKVWSEPMLKVSKRYCISDVSLAKICRRLGIPVPPRGYWARITHGQKIMKPESDGDLLLLRGITPLARRHTVYSCSGAYKEC
jgi:hypothetical protein